MRYASGQLADGFHFLGLAQLIFGLGALRQRPGHACFKGLVEIPHRFVGKSFRA